MHQLQILRNNCSSSRLLATVPSTRQDVLIRCQWSFARHWRRTRPVPYTTQASLTYTFGQFEFLRQLSIDPANTVIGLVRDIKSTKAKVTAEINRSNLHIIHGDLDSYQSLKAGLRRSSWGILLIDVQRKQAKPPRKSLAEALTILSPTEPGFPKVLATLALQSCKCPFSMLNSIRCNTTVQHTITQR